MDRRQFLAASLTATCGLRMAQAEIADRLKEIRITQITGFRHVCPRPKLVGMNSHLGIHGRTTSDRVLIISTNQGIEGIGQGRANPQTARELLGHRLSEYWKPGMGIVSPLGRADHALFDLVGKVLKVPSWQLFGGKGPKQIPVYDGSIYFNDILPENKAHGIAVLLKEVEASLERGHRAFKIKVGRGWKWMPKKEGFKRDIEVVKAIRKTVGKNVKLMTDSNNGYDLETTKRFLDAAGDDFYFVEEMFPEKVEEDLNLKAYLRKKGWKTFVADGESARTIAHFEPYLRKAALDVLQPDIRAFGLSLQWQLSQKIASKPGIKLAPHNWGSFLGLYMQAILGRGIPNFLMAEQDTSASDLFDTSGFVFKEGRLSVPNTPGCGLQLKKKVFEKKYKKDAWVVK